MRLIIATLLLLALLLLPDYLDYGRSQSVEAEAIHFWRLVDAESFKSAWYSTTQEFKQSLFGGDYYRFIAEFAYLELIGINSVAVESGTAEVAVTVSDKNEELQTMLFTLIDTRWGWRINKMEVTN